MEGYLDGDEDFEVKTCTGRVKPLTGCIFSTVFGQE